MGIFGIRIPLIVGFSIELLGIGFILLALNYSTRVQLPSINLIVYLFSEVCLVFFPHCLVHFIVGSLVGIRFNHFRIVRSAISKLGPPGKLPSLPVLCLVVDHGSLKRCSAVGRAAMYASGAIASMMLPFSVVGYAFSKLPFSLWLVCLMFAIANLAFDIYYSPRVGDISRIS